MTARLKGKRKREPELPTYVARDMVDNPGELIQGQRVLPSDAPAKIIAFRSYRDDPLALMLSRKQITKWQFEAGRAWQRLYREADVTHVKAMDPTKEPVDGGGNVMLGLADRKLDAVDRKNALVGKLRAQDVRLLDFVLIAGMGIREYAHATGWNTARNVKAAGLQFRQVLELLAKEFGYA